MNLEKKTLKNWELYYPCEDDPNAVIIPRNDLEEHDRSGRQCWCEPFLEFENKVCIVIHEAKDGRK